MQRKGKQFTRALDDGVLLKALSDEVFLGVEGCEGISRVYDFAISR